MDTLSAYQKAVNDLAADTQLSAADTSYLAAVQQRHGAPDPHHATPAGSAAERYFESIARLNSTRPWAGSDEPAALGRQTKDLIRSGGGVLYL